MPSPTQAERSRRQSYVLHALAYYAKKHADRAKLDPGDTRISGYVNATIGRADLHLPFSGTLQVGGDGTSASSSGPDPAQLLALALEALPKGQRTRFLARIQNRFAQTQTLPEAPADLQSEATLVLKRLRSRTTTTKRGSVVFKPDPEPADAAKAA